MAGQLNEHKTESQCFLKDILLSKFNCAKIVNGFKLFSRQLLHLCSVFLQLQFFSLVLIHNESISFQIITILKKKKQRLNSKINTYLYVYYYTVYIYIYCGSNFEKKKGWKKIIFFFRAKANPDTIFHISSHTLHRICCFFRSPFCIDFFIFFFDFPVV